MLIECEVGDIWHHLTVCDICCETVQCTKWSSCHIPAWSCILFCRLTDTQISFFLPFFSTSSVPARAMPAVPNAGGTPLLEACIGCKSPHRNHRTTCTTWMHSERLLVYITMERSTIFMGKSTINGDFLYSYVIGILYLAWCPWKNTSTKESAANLASGGTAHRLRLEEGHGHGDNGDYHASAPAFEEIHPSAPPEVLVLNGGCRGDRIHVDTKRWG